MRIFNLSAFIFLVYVTNCCVAQNITKSKDFKCFDKGVYNDFDLLKTTRTYGDYEPQEEWSQPLTSDKIFKKNVELEGGRQYVILLATEVGVAATGLEIRDSFGEKLEYESKISDLDKNQITFFYTADRDDVYQILFRVITLNKSSACTYMAVMKGEMDPEDGEE